MNIVSTIILFHYLGLIGIGIASVVNYLIYGVYVFFVLHSRFQFNFRTNTIKITIISLVFGLISSVSIFILEFKTARLIIATLLIISIVFTYKELNKSIDIIKTIKNLKRKYSK